MCLFISIKYLLQKRLRPQPQKMYSLKIVILPRITNNILVILHLPMRFKIISMTIDLFFFHLYYLAQFKLYIKIYLIYTIQLIQVGRTNNVYSQSWYLFNYSLVLFN
jgi:hypothetical protein